MKPALVVVLLLYMGKNCLGQPELIIPFLDSTETVEIDSNANSYGEPLNDTLPLVCFQESTLDQEYLDVLDTVFAEYEIFELDIDSIVNLLTIHYPHIASIVLCDDNDNEDTLLLWENRDLKSTTYEAWMEVDSGDWYEITDSTASIHHYEGFANGDTNYFARLSFGEGFIYGAIYDLEDTSRGWFYEPISLWFPDAAIGSNGYRVLRYRWDGPFPSSPFEEVQPIAPELDEPDPWAQCKAYTMEIVTEADQQYAFDNTLWHQFSIWCFCYKNIYLFPELMAAQVNTFEAVYQKYFNLSFRIVGATKEPYDDPYSSLDPENRLLELADVWDNGSYQNHDWRRDAVILWDASGEVSQGGIARQGGVCSSNSEDGYAINWHAHDAHSAWQSTITAAHEVGHLCNMDHIVIGCGTGLGLLMCGSAEGLNIDNLNIDRTRAHIQQNGDCLSDFGAGSDWMQTFGDTGRIGTWLIGSGHWAVVGNFNGGSVDQLLMIAPEGRWSNMIEYRCRAGGRWDHEWSNFGNDQIGYWVLHEGDYFVGADFDGDDSEELLSISGSGNWAMVQSYSNNTWSHDWSNSGGGEIGPWEVQTWDDRFFTGDFDDDGKAELLIINRTSEEAVMLDFENGAFQNTPKWSNGSTGTIGAWNIDDADLYRSGDFDGDLVKDLLMIRDDWAQSRTYDDNTNTWVSQSSNGGSGSLGGWQLPPTPGYYSDYFLPGQVDQDNKDELLFFQRNQGGWAATMDLDIPNSEFDGNWSNGGTNPAMGTWDLRLGINSYGVVRAYAPSGLTNPESVIGFKYDTDIDDWVVHMYNSDVNQNFKIPYDTVFLGHAYPNPTGDIAYIPCVDDIALFELIDDQGRTLGSWVATPKGGQFLLDLATVPSGIYLVRVASMETSRVFKVVRL
jgi:hypothetical protein